jgi:hypothetical protein
MGEHPLAHFLCPSMAVGSPEENDQGSAEEGSVEGFGWKRENSSGKVSAY